MAILIFKNISISISIKASPYYALMAVMDHWEVVEKLADFDAFLQTCLKTEHVSSRYRYLSLIISIYHSICIFRFPILPFSSHVLLLPVMIIIILIARVLIHL